MRHYFDERHEELFKIHTYNNLDGLIGGKQCINVMPNTCSSRIQYGLSYNMVNAYYAHYTVIRFCEALENFLIKENINLYVEKKIGVGPVSEWIEKCNPYIEMSTSQFVKFKMVVL